MKKLVVLLSLIATASAFSQGQIKFNNFIPSAGIDAPISYAAGGPATAGRINGASTAPSTVINGVTYDFGGINARVALYFGSTSQTEDQFQILTPSVGFTTGTLLGYANVGSAQNRTLPSPTFPAGSSALFQIRAWDTGLAPANGNTTSYEQGLTAINAAGVGYFGKSTVIQVDGLTISPTTPKGIAGLTAFSINYVPEPSIIGLGILGAIAGLVAFRRRN